MPAYDWEKLRQEYVADPTTSFKKLADKHGISLNVIKKKAIADRWYEQRNQKNTERAASFEEKMVGVYSSDAENILKARRVLTVRALEMSLTATRPSDIINLTNALQILARLTGVQSAIDEQEQKARIASIEAKVQTPEDEDEAAGVIFLPEKDTEEVDTDE